MEKRFFIICISVPTLAFLRQQALKGYKYKLIILIFYKPIILDFTVSLNGLK